VATRSTIHIWETNKTMNSNIIGRVIQDIDLYLSH
jgi:hypothetical protein